MKKLLSIILTIALIASLTTTAFANLSFTDVTTADWFYDDVKTAVELGLINGKSETEFKPDDLLIYAEAVKLAACMHQLYFNGAITLTNGEPWYKSYADYCKVNGIITKDYNYDLNATRAGYMEIFAKALPDEELKAINSIPDGSIPDVNMNASYADSVYKLYRAGIVTGVDERHNCKPIENIKRCEVATIIARMMDETKRVKFDMQVNKIDNIGEIKDVEINYENKTQTIVLTPTDAPVLTTPDITIKDNESIIVGVTPEPTKLVDGGNQEYIQDTPLTIHKQPEGYEAEKYGEKYELEVQVFGGKAPYTYEWYYYAYRNEKAKIEDGDFVTGATSNALVLSVEKDNTLLGNGIFCKITDAEGTEVSSDRVTVYGPFSMPVEDVLSDSGNYILTGRIADGIIKTGDKVSVERNGKIIAIGTASDLQMFNKSLDEGNKDDNIGIVFTREGGVRPQSGDTVIKHKDSHVIDTSDIVN